MMYVFVNVNLIKPLTNTLHQMLSNDLVMDGPALLTLRPLMSTTVGILCFYKHLSNQFLQKKYASTQVYQYYNCFDPVSVIGYKF